MPPVCPTCRLPLPLETDHCPRCDPVFDAEVAADEPVEVGPAEPALPAPPSDDVRAVAGGHRVGHFAPPQRLAYALLASSLDRIRPDPVGTALGYLFVPVSAAAGAGAAVLAMGLAALAVRGLGGGGWVLYALPLTLIYAFKLMADVVKEGSVGFVVDGGRVVGWTLGRLRAVFSVGEPATLGLFFGAAFGMQWGLLLWAPGHGGLPIEGGAGETFLLTADNVLHGVLLDFAELYDLRVGERVAHTTGSATVFAVSRLAYDAIALLFAWEVYQRVKMRGFYRGFPADLRRADDLLAWLDGACADPVHWPRRFFDEFFFLVLVKEYVRGRYDLVRGLTAELGWLRVAPDVRALFRGPGGEPVFGGSYAGP